LLFSLLRSLDVNVGMTAPNASLGSARSTSQQNFHATRCLIVTPIWQLRIGGNARMLRTLLCSSASRPNLPEVHMLNLDLAPVALLAGDRPGHA
jgi:hypothetical protein